MDKNSDINKYILQNCIKRNVVNKKEKYAPIIGFVFAVSGAAALGKTAFCKNLESLSERPPDKYCAYTIHLDGFLLDRKTRQDRKLSGYNPESTDMPSNLLCEFTYFCWQAKRVIYMKLWVI